MTEVSRILNLIAEGNPEAADRLLPLVYSELRKLAAVRLAKEKPGQTLEATALVHEAYLRLVGNGKEQPWNSRGHFFGAAAESMRRILIESARRKQRVRHGGDLQRRSLLEHDALVEPPDERLLLLDAALSQLLKEKPAIGQLVKLRYFGGLTTEQAASALGISTRTAKRHWAYAKAWLRRDMDRRGFGDGPN